MVATWSDDDIWRLNRGGHDPHKVYAAYRRGEPQGPADGDPGQDHQGLRHGRGRRGAEHHPPAEEDGHHLGQGLPRPLQAAGQGRGPRKAALPEVPRRLAGTQVHARAAHGARRLPAARRRRPKPLPVPPLSAFERLLKAGGEGREFSTTMAFVRGLNVCCGQEVIGKRVVPIVPTSRAPSAWKACSARSASGTRTARTTCRRTPTR
jgi:pyruvate dehydrogenase E1 component